MKKFVWLCACLTSLLMLTSGKPADEVMTQENGTYIVNTTTLATDVVGYLETTPLKIYIKGDKIQRVEALPNQETPKYVFKVKKELLTKWDGKKVKDVMREINPQTDVITGATYSSNAVVENLKRGLQYYQKNKKK